MRASAPTHFNLHIFPCFSKVSSIRVRQGPNKRKQTCLYIVPYTIAVTKGLLHQNIYTTFNEDDRIAVNGRRRLVSKETLEEVKNGII